MRKLNLEHLEVESFETSDGPVARGTVHAHVTLELDCGIGTNPPACLTDELSCGGTCGPATCGCTQPATCAGSCTCPSAGPTCRETAPSPFGTCCGLTC